MPFYFEESNLFTLLDGVILKKKTEDFNYRWIFVRLKKLLI